MSNRNLDYSHRNPRYHRARQAAAARQRRLLFLCLAILAVLVVLMIILLQRPDSQVALESTTSLVEATGTPAVVDSVPTIPASLPDQASDAPGIGAAEPVNIAPAVPVDANAPYFDLQRFSYEPDFYQPQIQAFLNRQPGPLKEVRFQVGDYSHSFAEVLVSMSSLYSINPKIMLALLEQHSQLLSNAQPAPEQITWALGYQGEAGRRQGLFEQVQWGGIALRHAIRDYALNTSGTLPELVFADDVRVAVPPDISMSRYAMARVLAPTTTPENLDAKLTAFLSIYQRLFGDPRLAPTDWPPLAEPFLTRPMEIQGRVTSFFDHDTPFLQQNGSLLSFWGQTETFLSYDGHTGWDYALRPPDVILAAAAGTVVFAGNSEDGCYTPARAVVIDHGNGYRTLYWHLSTLYVETGQVVSQGMPLGEAGATGCAFGPHLHFQVQYLGRDVDPYGWCATTPDPWQQSPAGQQSAWLWADMPSPCGSPPPGVIVVDDTSPGFSQSGNWQTIALGYGGGAHYAVTSVGPDGSPWQIRMLDTPSVAIWRPELPRAGRYRVLTYIPYVLNGLDDSKTVRYHVRSSEGETEVIIDIETFANSWADLGTYQFDPSDPILVSTSTLAGDEGRGTWADAVAWVPVE